MELYLFIFLLLTVALTFVWTSIRVYRLTGINPVTFTQSESTHDYAGRLFKVLLFFLLVLIAFTAFARDYYPYLLPIWYLEAKMVRLIGWVLLHASLPWILLAQLQMGRSWRIGIDHQHHTDLITGGVFGYSRNPIFLGMLLSLVGLFFVLPNAFTLLVLVMSYVLIQIQVRLEEEYLLNHHGESYRRYQQRVRRWV